MITYKSRATNQLYQVQVLDAKRFRLTSIDNNTAKTHRCVVSKYALKTQYTQVEK